MQLQEWNKIHELSLGEEICISGYSVLKVPNGWIFYTNSANLATFVPDVLKTLETNHSPFL